MLKVVIITSDDPLYVRKFFENFKFSGNDINYKITAIASLKTFRESRLKTMLRVLRLYGPIDFSKLLLKYLKNFLISRSLFEICNANEIELFNTKTTKGREFVEWIKIKNPDIILSVSASEIFNKELIACSKICGINIHCGKLPRYRGYMPVFWQMYENQESITISFHEIVEKVDTGGLLKTELIKIEKNSSLDEIMTKVKILSALNASLLLNEIAQTRVKPEVSKLNLEESNYFTFPKNKDVNILKNNGFRMI